MHTHTLAQATVACNGSARAEHPHAMCKRHQHTSHGPVHVRAADDRLINKSLTVCAHDLRRCVRTGRARNFFRRIFSFVTKLSFLLFCAITGSGPRGRLRRVAGGPYSVRAPEATRERTTGVPSARVALSQFSRHLPAASPWPLPDIPRCVNCHGESWPSASTVANTQN